MNITIYVEVLIITSESVSTQTQLPSLYLQTHKIFITHQNSSDYQFQFSTAIFSSVMQFICFKMSHKLVQ
jgi:hypothetical protein